MRIVATPLTSGPVTPGKEQPGARTWRWNGKPPSWPYDPATHDQKPENPGVKAGNEARKQRRQERVATFAAALARAHGEGLKGPAAVQEAARKAGVSPKTGRKYAAELETGEGS